jgi:tetratricopeptide (TPR) repeat protein
MCEEKGHIFIPTNFSPSARERAEQLAEFLKLFELRGVFGDTFGGGEVTEGVRQRIETAWFVIALLSRDVKIGDDAWSASEWVKQELLWALAHKKECHILIEEGVQFTDGLIGNVERLTFKADGFSDVLVPLGRQLRALLNRHLLTTGIKKLPIHTHVSDELLRNECTDEAKLLILEVRHLSRQQRYEEALELAEKAARTDPKCWRAWTSLGAILVQLNKVDDGNKVFAQVLSDFAGNNKAVAAAYHNQAWVLEIKSGYNLSAKALREQARLYERALKLDPSRVYTRASLLINRLIRGEADGAERLKAERLLEDSLLYEGFLEALRFELDTRGAKGHKVLQLLPTWLRYLLYPIHLNDSDRDEH